MPGSGTPPSRFTPSHRNARIPTSKGTGGRHRSAGATPQRTSAKHDAYGEILDCAYQWVAAGGQLEPALWRRLSTLVEEVRVRWGQPDHGIWEVRTATRPFTYSAAMCQAVHP